MTALQYINYMNNKPIAWINPNRSFAYFCVDGSVPEGGESE